MKQTTTVVCEECGYQHELNNREHTPETCFGCGSYNLKIMVNGMLYRLTEADLKFTVQEIKERKSEVDIIGDVALKHAENSLKNKDYWQLSKEEKQALETAFGTTPNKEELYWILPVVRMLKKQLTSELVRDIRTYFAPITNS